MMLSCGLQPFHISTTLCCEDIIFEIFGVLLKAAPFVTISGSPPLVLALFWSQWSFWIDITCNILFVFIFCYFDNGESLQNAQLPQTNENACWAKIVQGLFCLIARSSLVWGPLLSPDPQPFTFDPRWWEGLVMQQKNPIFRNICAGFIQTSYRLDFQNFYANLPISKLEILNKLF